MILDLRLDYHPNFARKSAYGQSVDMPIFVRKNGDRHFFLYLKWVNRHVGDAYGAIL
jgi:hypothetical protein